MIKTPLGKYEAATGFILDWFVCGLFPAVTIGGEAPDLFDPKSSKHWRTDHLRAYGGEGSFRDIPRATGICALDWLPVQAPSYYPKLNIVELAPAYPEIRKAIPRHWDNQWYALAVLESDREQEAELRFCGWDGCRLWWNGSLVFEEHSWHHIIFDKETISVRLRKGRNSLLMKMEREGLVARLTAPGGGRLPGRVESLTTAHARDSRLGSLGQLTRHALTLKVAMPCRARNPRELRLWQRAARSHFRKAIGTLPEVGGIHAEEVRCERLDGYRRLTFHLGREAGSCMPVHVLVPDKEHYNGRTVICPHGHAQDDTVVAGIQPAPKPHGNWFGTFTGNYAEGLAKAGFLTATWGARVLSSERNDQPPGRREDPCNVAGLCALAMSLTLPGLHLSDAHAVHDFLVRRFRADPRRTGITGLSGGGTLSYLAGAYDDRFRAVALYCCLPRYFDYARGKGCGQQVVPNLFPTLDVPELLGLIAPRPLLVGQGFLDSGFDVFRLRGIAREASRAYQAAGARDHLRVDVFAGAHSHNTPRAIEFFLKSL